MQCFENFGGGQMPQMPPPPWLRTWKEVTDWANWRITPGV